MAHVVLGFWLSEEAVLVEIKLCCSFRRRCRGFTGRAMANNTQPICTEKYQDLKAEERRKRKKEVERERESERCYSNEKSFIDH